MCSSDLLLPGDEQTDLYKYLQKQAKNVMALLRASNILVLDRDSRVVISFPHDYHIGQQYPIVETDPFELKKVWQGDIVCSDLYRIHSKSFKTGYAPIKDGEGKVAYVLCVEIGASHQKVLDDFNQVTLYFCMVGIVLAFLAATLLWLSLTYPLRKLTQAMQSVSENRYLGPVPVQRKDEIGFLILRFNEMMQSLKEKEWELTQMYEKELERKKYLAKLGEFSAGVAHEIRNPLSAMEGFAGLLSRKLKNPEEKGMVERLVEEIHILNEIVNQILSYARESAYHFSAVPLFDLVREVIAAAVPEGTCPDLEIKLLLDPGIHTLWADAVEIRKALVNLVKNAVQAMEESPKKVLSIQTYRENEAIVLKIADTGQGIAPELIREGKVFEPFFTTREDGTGLGLSIASKIIEQHDARLKIESDVSEGTRVFVTFYRKESDEDGQCAGRG